MFSRPKILFLVSLLFVALLNPKFNPYLLFKFLIFYHSSKLSHARMFSRPKILFLVSLLFVALLNPKFNPYLLFKFLIFYHSSLFTFYTC